MEKQVSDKDCEYVKKELELRLPMMYTGGLGIITSALTVWSIAAAFFALIIQTSTINTVAAIICLIFFAAPGFFALPMSVKSGDNLTRVAQLAAYIRVFHELKDVVNDKGNDRMLYESAFKVLGHEKRLFFFNLEYEIIAFIAFMGELVITLYILLKGLSLAATIVGFVICASLLIVLCVVSYNAGVARNFMIKRDASEQKFIAIAIAMGIITAEEAEEYKQKNIEFANAVENSLKKEVKHKRK